MIIIFKSSWPALFLDLPGKLVGIKLHKLSLDGLCKQFAKGDRGRRGHVHMVAGYTTYVISAYHH